jgi:hypothetical protein
MNTFTIKGLFKEAWKDYKKYWGVILLIGLTFAIVQSFGFSGMNFDPYTGTLTQGGFGQLIGWIAGTWLSIGYLNFLLNIVDGNQANYKDIFYGVKSAEQFAYFVLVSLIYGAAVVLGLFRIVAGLFNVLGLIALGVGLLITIPMTQLMYARMFRKLEGIPLPEENEETIVEETHSEE